ncbi:hypothetical protein BU25DRAFT_167206 [Macroventuria anomochaeta]|uniref:Uncharacterized protein n=1 Tax=Macroventuria anomochaeta TaxID=301207 RepID=A0ACB6RRP8_9PLEO|nr:uncharacterized protein BU25DRAFT_167206 [Macroventuria anomochaeta]KAF2623813.1 hypothetical protein BU25DRAFT_167206 [Macroventuria anomochaeta]
MALKYVLAAFALGAASVNAQTTDNSNFYSVSDDYYNYGYTRRTSSKTSMFWTATLRYMDYVSVKPYTYAGITATYSTAYESTYIDVEIVQLYYATGAVAESDLVSRTTYDYYDTTTSSATTRSTYSTTEYYMPVTMTAPASCPTIFTVATQAEISYIPSIVTDQLKPTSTEVSTSTGRSYVAEYATWYLPEGAAPFTSTDDDNYYNYIASCTPPPAQYTSSTRTSGGSGSSSSGSDDDDSWTDYRTCYFGGCTDLKTWIIIIATILPGIFLLGFLESWFWYTRLMKGKSAMRCGTVCWILLSLCVLCFTRMQDARSKEDQKLLQQKWKEMPAGQKFKNWSWGFKRRYPVSLLGQFSKQTVGIVPEGQPLHPAMAQAPPGQVFYYGPPPPGAPGWQQGPNGGTPGHPFPAQGYPQQGGYYATNVPKDAVVVGSSPVPGTAIPPQAPQPAYHPPTSPPPNAQLPPQPQQAAPSPAPPAPVAAPTNVSEVPASQAREAPAAQATQPSQAPATTQPQPTHPAPAKNETSDDLYK